MDFHVPDTKPTYSRQTCSGRSRGLAGVIGFKPPNIRGCPREGKEIKSNCENDSWQWRAGKYKTLEKFIYRIFTETATSSTKTILKKCYQMGWACSRAGTSSHSGCTSPPVHAGSSTALITICTETEVSKHHCGHERLVLFTARASDWPQRSRLYKFLSNRVKNQKLMVTKTRISRQQDRDEPEGFFCQTGEGASSRPSYKYQQRTPSALRKWPCWKYKGFSSASPNCSAGTGNTHPFILTRILVAGRAGEREENPSRKWQLEQRLTSYGENIWSVSPSSCLLFQPGRSSREPLTTGSSPWEGGGRGLRSLADEVSLMAAGGTQRGQMADRCVSLDGGRSSRAWTVRPTFTRPRSSRMWWGRHSLSCDAQMVG